MRSLFYITPSENHKFNEIPPGLYRFDDSNDEIKNQLTKNDDACEGWTPIELRFDYVTLE